MKTRRLVVMFLLLLGLGGCASTPRAVSDSESAAIRRVAVVSVLAQEFHRGYTGFTVFGNEYESADISSWNVDAAYEDQIGEVLRELGKTPVVVKVNRKDFLPAQLPNGPYEAPAFNTPRWDAITQVVKNIAATENLDALVIVVRRISPDFLARTNQSFRGVGYYARGFGDSTRVSVAHAIGFVGLLNGKTGSVSAMSTLQVTDQISPEEARKSISQLGASQRDVMQRKLVSLPRGYWERSVRDVFGR